MIYSVYSGSLSGLGMISVKTKLSKIIAEDEVGKVFSLSSTIEALVPFAASLIYSNLFSLTIGTYPGLFYLFSCCLMTVSLMVMVIERCFCPVNSLAELAEAQQVKQKAVQTA